MQCKICNSIDFINIGGGMYQCQSCQTVYEPKKDKKDKFTHFDIVFALADNNIKGLAIVGLCLIVAIQMIITTFKIVVGMNINYALLDFLGLLISMFLFFWFSYELGKRKL